MSRQIWSQPVAIQDLVDNAAYLGEQSSSVESRFLDAVQHSLELLAGTPELGGIYETKSPRLANVRMWRVKGFENYVIFYRPSTDRIEIIRVLHGARDIATILAGD